MPNGEATEVAEVNEQVKKEIFPLLEKVRDTEAAAVRAVEEIEIARVAVKKAMMALGVKTVSMPQFDANGRPDTNITANLQGRTATSIDLEKVEKLLTDAEKTPYTKFKINVTDFEKNIQDGVFLRTNPADLDELKHCVTRVPGEQTVVIKGLKEKLEKK